MLFKTFSAAVFGIDAYLVEVEVDVAPAFEGHFTVVGLPDIAVKESRERIRAALRNCGFDFPSSHVVTINLAPADIRKEGSAFDLPMALGLAGCQGSFFGKILDTHVFWVNFRWMAACGRCAGRFRRRGFSSQEGKSFTEELGTALKLTTATGSNLWSALPDGSDLAAIPADPQIFGKLMTDAVGYQDFANSDDVYDGASVFVFGYPGDAKPFVRQDGLVRAVTRYG